MKNKRGAMMGEVKGLIVGIVVLLFVIFALFFGLAALKPSTFFDTSTAANNASSAAIAGIQQNLTYGVSQWSTYIPTMFIVLGVVMILVVIALLVLVAVKMAGSAGGAGGGLGSVL